MVKTPITRALIIAAGNGARLKRFKGDATPKPLRRLLSIPLLERIIRSTQKAGIEAVTVVVGYQSDKIRAFLASQDFGVAITVVENPDWKKSNGISVLSAKDAMGKDSFVLLMADHIFDPDALRECLEDGVHWNGVKLAVDSRIHDIDDLDDATKVQCTPDGKILHIGKPLTTYNAIDTGIFCCTSTLFDILESLHQKQGNCSLSDGMQVLASEGRLQAWTFPQTCYWQDVDTPAAFKIAEKKLLRACIKPTDGFISRNFNRYISLFITKRLIKHTTLSANTVTGLVTLVGAMSGVIAAKGGYGSFLVGAILFKLASILDGCDGEMSRLRFSNSKLGQWLDTVSDNLTYVCFFIGIMAGTYRTHYTPYFPYLMGATVLGITMLLLLMFIYLVRYTDSGSLVSIQKDVETEDGIPKSFAATVASKLGFMIKRDFFATFFLVCALIGKGHWIFYALLIGSNIAWMVLFNLRRNFFGNTSDAVRESSY